MIGIRFLIKNEYDNVLGKVLHDIDCTEYKWEVVNEEVLGENGKRFLIKSDYSNEKFKKNISKEHYPIFLNLQMFYRNSNKERIENYNQFLKSSCQLIIFIVDTVFIEIYVKDQEILEKIASNVEHNQFNNIELIKENSNAYKLFSNHCQLLNES